MNLGLVVDLCFVFEVGFDFEVAEKIVWHDVPHTTKTQSNPEGRLTRGATMWHLRFGNVKDHAMRLTPNLAFAGQCEPCSNFMSDALGAKSSPCSRMANRPCQNKCHRDGARRSSMRLSRSVNTFWWVPILFPSSMNNQGFRRDAWHWRTCRSIRHTLGDQLRANSSV